jgi:hypothetical protein
MDRLLQDLRYGGRGFLRQPGFTLTAILALALGIGANTAVFSVVYAVLIKPMPYPQPEALVYIHDSYPAVSSASVSFAKLQALREGTRTLSALGGLAPIGLTLTGSAQPEQVSATQFRLTCPRSSASSRRVGGGSPQRKTGQVVPGQSSSAISCGTAASEANQKRSTPWYRWTACRDGSSESCRTVEATAGNTRLVSILTSVFALVAALLAGVGVYSLMAYSVAQRTREIGIRVALGANRRAVVRMIMTEGVKLATIGVAIGLIAAHFLTQTLQTLLYEVRPADPIVLIGTCAGVFTVALLASVVPALRALRVGPMIALRSE